MSFEFILAQRGIISFEEAYEREHKRFCKVYKEVLFERSYRYAKEFIRLSKRKHSTIEELDELAKELYRERSCDINITKWKEWCIVL